MLIKLIYYNNNLVFLLKDTAKIRQLNFWTIEKFFARRKLKNTKLVFYIDNATFLSWIDFLTFGDPLNESFQGLDNTAHVPQIRIQIINLR